MGACLWAREGVASHRTAAAVWELDGIEPGVIEITSPVRRQAHTIVVHRTRLLSPTDVIRVKRIPVTRIERTLFDLASVATEEQLELALDSALRRGLTNPQRVVGAIDRLAASGRLGSATLKAMMAARPALSSGSESVLETRLWRLLRSSRLPLPERQYRVLSQGTLLGRVDFAWPHARVALEADGYRYHHGRMQWSRDLARRNALVAAGWTVAHATWDDIHDDGKELLDRLSTILRPSLGF